MDNSALDRPIHIDRNRPRLMFFGGGDKSDLGPLMLMWYPIMPLFITELKKYGLLQTHWYVTSGVYYSNRIAFSGQLNLGGQNQDSGVFAAPTGQNGPKPILGLVCSRGPWGQLIGMYVLKWIIFTCQWILSGIQSFSSHEGISAFSVWTQCGLLSPQCLGNFAEIRFHSAIVPGWVLT
jgi:hypothetical protein